MSEYLWNAFSQLPTSGPWVGGSEIDWRKTNKQKDLHSEVRLWTLHGRNALGRNDNGLPYPLFFPEMWWETVGDLQKGGVQTALPAYTVYVSPIIILLFPPRKKQVRLIAKGPSQNNELKMKKMPNLVLAPLFWHSTVRNTRVEGHHVFAFWPRGPLGIAGASPNIYFIKWKDGNVFMRIF